MSAESSYSYCPNKPYSLSLSFAEKEELDSAISALQNHRHAMMFLHEWEMHMRSIYKYGSDEAQTTTWEAVKEKYFELKAEYPKLEEW